jgi:hypothetical protein
VIPEGVDKPDTVDAKEFPLDVALLLEEPVAIDPGTDVPEPGVAQGTEVVAFFG